MESNVTFTPMKGNGIACSVRFPQGRSLSLSGAYRHRANRRPEDGSQSRSGAQPLGLRQAREAVPDAAQSRKARQSCEAGQGPQEDRHQHRQVDRPGGHNPACRMVLGVHHRRQALSLTGLVLLLAACGSSDSGGQVPIERGPAHAEVLGDVLAGVTIRLHPFGGGDVLGILDLSRPPEPGAVGARNGSDQFLSQLGCPPEVAIN